MSAIGKLLLSILVCVSIVGAALWILGGKQAEYSTALSIAAPPEAIFPYLTQPERLKGWTSGLSQVEELLPAPKVDGAPSGGRVKLTPRVLSLADGSQVRYEDRVIRYEENVSISVQSTNDQQVVTAIYQLEPRDGQTFFSYRVKTSSQGIGRFMAPLSSNDLQNRIDGDIRKLKTLVESSPFPVAAKVATDQEPTAPDSSDFEPAVQSNATPDVSVSSNTPDVSQRYKSGYPETPPAATQQPALPALDNPIESSGLIVPSDTLESSNGPNAETPVSGQPFSF